MADGYGVSRYKNDFMEEKEHRLTMFNVPNRLPIGNERSRMGATEFARRSAPALADAYRLEQGVLKIMEDATKDIHGGEKMAYAAFNKAPRVKEEFFKERMAAASPHPSFFSQKQPQMTNLLVDDNKPLDGRVTPNGYIKGGHVRGVLGSRGGKPSSPSAGLSPGPRSNKLLPSSAMLGYNESASWVVDRDHKNLTFGTDPAHLEQAAMLAAENQRMGEHNKRHQQQSVIPFGSYDLNPGGHRLNADVARHDDYGIGRLRSEGAPEPQPTGQVAALMADYDPRQPDRLPLPHSPAKPFAGRGQRSTLSLDDSRKPEPRRPPPFAGRRAQSTVFDGEGSGPAGPQAPLPGTNKYVGISHDGPSIKHNPHAGKNSNSTAMHDLMRFDPQGQHDDTNAAHGRRRERLAVNARRVPEVEEVVFGQPQSAQLARDPHSEPAARNDFPEGKRAMQEARAAQTQVGPQEFGGAPADAATAHPNALAAAQQRGRYADQSDLLHYEEFKEAALGGRLPPPPPAAAPSQVGAHFAAGTTEPHAYSHEPSGLPRRHPGAERLKRSSGVDGHGNDHMGRQIATSLVDEVIFNRANFKGSLQLGQMGANFAIDVAGEFAKR